MAKTKKTSTSRESIDSRKPGTSKGVKTVAAGEAAKLTLDRRGKERRKPADRRSEHVPVVSERRTLERRAKVSRRRQIDPTTCERDYTDEEVQFMNAVEQYKRTSGRMFPTCSEILEVLRDLGYEKRLPIAPEPPVDMPLSPVEVLPTPTVSVELPVVDTTDSFSAV